jgi:benzodiazapine receptor
VNRDLVRQWVNVAAFALMVTMNGLAVSGRLNGQDTASIARNFDVYFVPADYVFSIWSLIYLLLLLFAVYQALPSQRKNAFARRIGYLFALSCAANIAWIFLWHYLQFAWSVVAMVVLLGSLVLIYVRSAIGRSSPAAADRWLVQLPFSVYLGWVTVAAIANVTAVLDFWHWDGWGISPEMWTLIMLAVVVAIASAVASTRRDWAYLLVLVWALAGIGVKNADTGLVAYAAWLAAAAAGLLAAISVARSWRGGRVAV